MKKLAPFVLIAMSAPAAWAQYGEIWFNAGQSLFRNNGLGTVRTVGGTKNDVKLEDGFRFGFRIAFNGDGHLGHEVQYAYARTQLNILGTKQGMAVHGGGYNFLYYATTEGTRIRPFGTGGVGFANYVPPGASALQGGGDNKFGFNYGGGVKVRVTGPYAVRFDLRQYTTPKPFNLPLKEGWIRYTEVSGGVGFVF
jgi:opacity protein-like surface antigen